jgi:hypothetical protein
VPSVGAADAAEGSPQGRHGENAMAFGAVERRVNSSSAMTPLRALLRNLEVGGASVCSWDMGSCAESNGQHARAALLERKAHGAAALQCTLSVETGDLTGARDHCQI